MNAAVILLVVFMGVFALVALSYVYYDFKTGVPTFPTMPAVRKKIIELLQADMAQRPDCKPYTIVDLGSGSGQMTECIARALPQARVVGIEISFIPWLRAAARQKLLGPANLTYRRMDFWSYNSAEADATIIYLLWTILDKMSAKLKEELRPGTMVLANTFAMSDLWTPKEVFAIEAPFIAAASGKTNLYLYRKEN